MCGDSRFVLDECRQGLTNCIKSPHCFVSVSFIFGRPKDLGLSKQD